jgi:methionine sulfoxide reductase heme-binding subunit
VTTLLATAPSPLWYATRGSGVVTLVLLTASVCLGILTTVRWRSVRVPRFVVAGLHRNVTLLAVAFLAVHVGTTIADGYTAIGLKDAIVPFLSSYRPLWLGLGTLSCDVLIAVVLTSLLRARLGYRAWRVTHWLAYASWPLALAHSLGTGSDARFSWMAALAIACIAAVTVSTLLRVGLSAGDARLRLVAAGATVFIPLLLLVWYRGGPARSGWAARAGTPKSILQAHSGAGPLVLAKASTAPRLPSSFQGSLTGQLTQGGPDSNGLVTVRIDTTVHGRVRGRLRLALKGIPVDGGGVSMTSSGVAFAAVGSPVFEGSIVGLSGDLVAARISAGSEGTFQLTLQLHLDSTGAVTGVVHGVRA